MPFSSKFFPIHHSLSILPLDITSFGLLIPSGTEEGKRYRKTRYYAQKTIGKDVNSETFNAVETPSAD
jgi:hypothetical protein